MHRKLLQIPKSLRLTAAAALIFAAGCTCHKTAPPPATLPSAQDASRDLAQPQPRIYAATNYNNAVEMEIDGTNGGYINGAMIIGESHCPFAAQPNGNSMHGMVVYGGNQCPFDAQVEGAVVYLDFVGMHWVLQRIQ
jgi:hypothetical protein